MISGFGPDSIDKSVLLRYRRSPDVVVREEILIQLFDRQYWLAVLPILNCLLISFFN